MPRLVPGFVATTATANAGSGKATIGTQSVQVMAAFDRTAVYLTNTGSTTISIGLGATAVAGQGIVLSPGTAQTPAQVITLNGFSGVINAISSATGGTLAYCEF